MVSLLPFLPPRFARRSVPQDTKRWLWKRMVVGVGRSRGEGGGCSSGPGPSCGAEFARSTLPMFRREKPGPGRAIEAAASRGDTL